jgi:CheY-like chemotaxis protein
MCAENTILLVEPRAGRSRRLERILGEMGRNLLIASSRREALNALFLNRVSVILTAASLRDGRWQDLLSDTAPMLPAAPSLIVLSSAVDEPLPAEVLNLGGSGLLSEPFFAGEVKRMVEMATGDWVRRCLGQHGPLASGVDAEAVPRGSQGPMAIPRILVIDDEPMILSMIRRTLEAQGLEVTTAENGSHGIDLFQGDARICLVILDWQMPGMSGEQVFDKLLAIRSGVKVIVSSGAAPSQVDRAFSAHKEVQFLPKPFQGRALVTAVKSALAA